MMWPINKSTDWPHNYHKIARMFPQISWTSQINEYADSKRASNNTIHPSPVFSSNWEQHHMTIQMLHFQFLAIRNPRNSGNSEPPNDYYDVQLSINHIVSKTVPHLAAVGTSHKHSRYMLKVC